ncbi:MAG: small multi-drug export protein [Candidatus Brocadiia bacterium]
MSGEQQSSGRPETRLETTATAAAEEGPRQELSRATRLAMTMGPFVVLGLLVLAASLAGGYKTAGFLLGALFMSFAGLGKLVIFWGLPDKAPLSMWALAGLIVFGDVGTALIMMGNVSLLYRLPVIGRRLAAAHEAGRYVLQANPWMRRATWLGIVLFVSAPFQGTGAVVATIVARILGVARITTLVLTFLGSAIGCLGLAVIGAHARGPLTGLADNPLAAVAMGLAMVALLVYLSRRFTGQAMRHQAALSDGSSDPGSAPPGGGGAP